MPYTDFHRHDNNTDYLYAVPMTAGDWSIDGLIDGDDSAIPGLYVFAGMADATAYEVRVRSGAEPTESDDPVAAFDPPPPSATSIASAVWAADAAIATITAAIADVPKKAELHSRTLPAEDYFDPAADTVARVTLVDTTTFNSDMRGTDGVIAVPDSPDFSGITATGSSVTITVKQRDDYSAVDGRAFTWAVAKPGINFADASVTIGAAGGRAGGYAPDAIAATMTLLDKANGSCKIRIEFTAAQLDVPAKTYNFDAHILVDSRRVTTTEITLNVIPKYADEAP